MLQWRLCLRLIISSWYASVSLLMVFARCCKQRTISFFSVYGCWELKLKYYLVKVSLRYTDDLNPCSVGVTNTSRKGNLLSCSFTIVNCIDGRIEFTWSSNIWTSSCWGQRMNMSSTYLSHIDGYSDVDPNAISSNSILSFVWIFKWFQVFLWNANNSV